jgi:predicted dehydrogenase
MNGPIASGVIGAGPQAHALIDHQAPLGRVHLAAFAASPDAADAAPVADLARQANAPVRPWQDIVADPSLPVILVFAPPASRATITAGALASGKTVLCPPPVATSAAELAVITKAHQSGGGRLLCGGEIAHSDAGRHGLAALRAPAFGPLRSLYLAIRQPRGGTGDIIETIGWEALDFILAAIPGGFAPPRLNAGALFGADRDSAVLLLRSETNVVVTVELARCLPPTLPASGLGEIEIDVMGAHQSLRITPSASAVQIHRDDGGAGMPWLNAPVLSMLRAIETPDPAPDALDRATRALALMHAIQNG